MKVLVLFSCALALATAGWAPAPAPVGYHGPQHVPVIHNGVPVETPEVQHAKAAHLAALAEASSRPGYHAIEPQHEEYSGNQYQQNDQYQQNNAGHQGHGYSFHAQHNAPAPVHHHAPAPVHHAPINYAAPKAPVHPAYETSHVLPSIGHDGKPLDTPEVEEAKSHHFAEFSRALAATAPHQPEEPQQYHNAPQQHYRRRRGLYAVHYPVINHHGVPVEPLEVQHARSAHLAAHHAPAHGYSTHQVHAPIYGHHYEHWIPKYDHHGRPLDTAEVEHAKQAHFHAFHEAAARNSVHPVAHHGYASAWGHQDVPHDTPEVAHAKALHFAAHAAAKGHHY